MAGEVPRSRELRLVLDDEEMDPALSASPVTAPSPEATLPPEGDSKPASDDAPDSTSAPVLASATEAMKAVDASDLLTACLDEVFEVNTFRTSDQTCHSSVVLILEP